MIIKTGATLGDYHWGSYEPKMENRTTVSGAMDDRIHEILDNPESRGDIAWMWIGGSPMSPYTGKLRRVTVEITSFIGTMSLGAKHFYVKVFEEPNLLWDWESKRWMLNGRDYRFKGLELHNGNQFTENEFINVKDCIDWARHIVSTFFPGHKIDEDWEEDYEDW